MAGRNTQLGVAELGRETPACMHRDALQGAPRCVHAQVNAMLAPLNQLAAEHVEGMHRGPAADLEGFNWASVAMQRAMFLPLADVRTVCLCSCAVLKCTPIVMS